MNKVDSGLTSMWVNFFTAAGIPSDVSATYALTFTENRIQNDMLLDLNKEYLRDMGISRMGDVIAILRHAKQVHESAARDRVLSSAGAGAGAGAPGAAAGPKVPVAAVTGRLTVAQTKPSSPASRILEHYTRNPSSSSSRDTSPAKSPKLKRKHTETGIESPTGVKKTRLIRLGSPPPTTNKTSVAEGASTKQTVFARLGGADSAKAVTVSAAATRPDQSRPVFARLGAKPDATPAGAPHVPIDKDALKYEGILKSGTVKKVVTVTTSKDNVRKIAMNCTMRADEVPVNIKQKLNMPKAKSVKFSQRVEYKEIEAASRRERLVMPKTVAQKPTSVFNKPERRLSMPEVVKSASDAPLGASSGIKARLGTKNANNLTITRGIFSRLGV